MLGLGSLMSHAEILTPEQAVQKLSSQSGVQARKARGLMRNKSVEPMITVEAQGQPAVYVMQPDETSLLLLSAESEAPVLLGYSDNITDKEDLPDGFRAMLQSYADEIEQIRHGQVRHIEAESTVEMTPIAPLCRTNWDQGNPFNYYCPKLNNTRSVTGCVATAMAQVLRVMEWPAKCNGGSETYSWVNGKQNLTLDFDAIELNWGVMKDFYAKTTINTASKAVATLMQAVGYAAEMNYSPTASGARGDRLIVGLVKHFDYDCTLSYEHHDWYTEAGWQQLIYNELAKGIPVYVDGATGDLTAGHAFVVDGYDGDGYFHLNWGWAGMSDGYYRLTALDPTMQGIGGSNGGYNFMQGAIVGMIRGQKTPYDQRPLQIMLDGDFTTQTTPIKLAADVRFSTGLYNVGTVTIPSIRFGVKFVNNETGEEKTYTNTQATKNLQPQTGITSYSVHLPTSLPSGNYTVYPIVYDPTNKVYYDVKCKIGGYGQLSATVEDKTVTFSDPEYALIRATDFKLESPLYLKTQFALSMTVTNPTSQPYGGGVTPYFYSTDDQPQTYCIPQMLELMPGESKTLTLLFNAPNDLKVGEYKLRLFDDSYYSMCEPITVNVQSRPGAGVLRCNSLTVVDTTQDNLTFDVNVTCTDGYYDEPVFVVIWKEDGSGSYLTYLVSEPQLLGRGETATVRVNGGFPGGTPGTTYSAGAFYMNRDQNANVPMDNAELTPFTLTQPIYGEGIAPGPDVESGLDEISTNSAIEWFDLQGRRVAQPKAGTIMIKRQGNNISKVRI